MNVEKVGGEDDEIKDGGVDTGTATSDDGGGWESGFLLPPSRRYRLARCPLELVID